RRAERPPHRPAGFSTSPHRAQHRSSFRPPSRQRAATFARPPSSAEWSWQACSCRHLLPLDPQPYEALALDACRPIRVLAPPAGELALVLGGAAVEPLHLWF